MIKIKEYYSNYDLDDVFSRTFMMPAVMPKNSNNITQMNMLNNVQNGIQNNNNLNMKGYIYRITNKVNGKSYIGQTRNTVEFRWR